MRVGHLSSFPPAHCGLATYAAALVDAMVSVRRDEHVVLAQAGAPEQAGRGWRALPTFDARRDYVAAVAERAGALGLDVVEVQYTPDLLGHDDRLLRVVRELGARRTAVVVNCHSVFPPRWRGAARFDRALAQAAAAIVVHTPRMRDDLLARGVPAAKIAVIPHGTRIVRPPARAASRAALGLPADVPLLVFFGFVWPGKGLELLIDAFAEIARRVPDALLLVAGWTRKRSLEGAAYMRWLRARAAWRGIRGRVRFTGGYVPDDQVDAVFGAADVVALPYRQDYSSASGVVHQAAGMDRLPFCSRIAKFDEVADEVSPSLLADPRDLAGWIAGLTGLLGDRDGALVSRLRARLRAFAERTQWERVAERRLALYDAVAVRRSTGAAGLRAAQG